MEYFRVGHEYRNTSHGGVIRITKVRQALEGYGDISGIWVGGRDDGKACYGMVREKDWLPVAWSQPDLEV